MLRTTLFTLIPTLFFTSVGNAQVKAHQKIANNQGGFTEVLPPGSQLGISLATLDDFDGDGVIDLVAGAISTEERVYILFMTRDGTIKAQRKISAEDNIFGGKIEVGDGFGISAASLGDLNEDGVIDLAVGARWDDDGGTNRGAVWILFLKADGSVTTRSIKYFNFQ